MGVFRRAKSIISSLDMHSIAPSITFKRNHSYKSLYGGIFSLIVIIFMSIIAFNGFKKLYNKDVKSTMISKDTINLYEDRKEHHFMVNGPQFYFSYVAPYIPLTDNWISEDFFKPMLLETSSGVKDGVGYFNDSFILSDKCDEKVALDKFGFNVYYSNSSIWFSKAFPLSSYTIYGAESSISKLYKARLEKWDPARRYWAPEQQIRDSLYWAEFRAYVINKYYDFSDIQNPIKEYFDDTIIEAVDYDYLKHVRILVRENRVTQYDSIWPWADPVEYVFYSVSDIHKTLSNASENKSTILVEYLIKMDSQVGKLIYLFF